MAELQGRLLPDEHGFFEFMCALDMAKNPGREAKDYKGLNRTQRDWIRRKADELRKYT
jgi:hypothetical protein